MGAWEQGMLGGDVFTMVWAKCTTNDIHWVYWLS